jgi:hypothetical protein
MIAFAMVVLDELVHSPTEVPLPYRDYTIERFVFD